MTYKITGLSPELTSPFEEATEEQLSALGAVRMTATGKPGFPCRISLKDAEVGEEVILFHHTSHDVDSPYRNSYAIFARTGLSAAAQFIQLFELDEVAYIDVHSAAHGCFAARVERFES